MTDPPQPGSRPPSSRSARGRRAPHRGAREGRLAPGLFWLGGFNSDMAGTKALALDACAAEHGRACVRFDYSGHGESGGAFIDGTIGRWLEESLAVFEQFCQRPASRDRLVDGRLDGATAGARNGEAAGRRASLAGLVLIAPAPDSPKR